MQRWPDFFVVGAPKSGTTTIYQWLKNHPAIFVPKKEKEPRYFCGLTPNFSGPGADTFNRTLVSQEQDYFDLFEEAQPSQLCGDFSVDYLGYELAAVNIKKHAPNAKIIMVLRNPIKRAFSEHLHLVRDLWEDRSFAEALEQEEARRQAGWQPLFFHKKRGLYSEAVKRYFDLFGRENVRVYLYEDLVAAPEAMMRDLCGFLGIAQAEFDFSLRTNVSGTPHSMLLQKLLQAQRIKPLLMKLIGRDLGSRIKWWLISRNTSKGAQIDASSEANLSDYFRADIQALEGLLGRDLSSWVAK